ncbi:Uncharacterized 2Fe-2 and 4Fe-4S clusters-containing protein, contains DUF4445 domain [Pseudobutyrivibrio sp. YE44]|uniref:ASKHA domain-containing protein n=1 Tax=Pseudobutyrivibrio sp. YE44 TaxID=1520802 RepID=UPI00088640AB|nr:ASKHA domain-containing protein [Pseudobutyrivibrio sp. YE44]SDB49699.1 Uncharacterized 2Fe-2 and 4Fe-4S clusters-containing protein, contains DUF4445 domain [Pseudobutyrivibrio sp. YE44]
MEIKIVIEDVVPEQEYVYMTRDEEITFGDVMDHLGLKFYRPCGGIGKCLSCAIRFVYGAPEMTSNDERALDFSEMRNGWRIGCKCVITKDCKIQVPKRLVSEITSVATSGVEEELPLDKTNIAIAVDIGTTTLAAAAVELGTGKILRQRTWTNGQLKFGADVMSRIKASIEGNRDELSQLVIKDLMRLGTTIIGEDFLTHRVVISGNTVMTHLMLKYPMDGMAKYPFVPYTTDAVKFRETNRNIFFMPSISAFVGGDIVSGLYYIKREAKLKNKEKETFLFVDMGTNAEIVLFDGEKYWCSSASAGPALEGASLSCGCASIAGAINHISINNRICKFTTIGGEKPIGICGSGIIDLIHELRRNELIDEGGLLIEEYADTGFPITEDIIVTGEDIQQVILAKAAIRSGLQMLMEAAKLPPESIDHLYVSGGLGATISIWAAAGIGLFSMDLIPKFESLGNTSLIGDIAFIMEPDEDALKEIKDNSQVVLLATTPRFEELFLENLKL